LKGEGYEFAVVRVYQSTGQVDPNGIAMIANAHAAGIEYVDGYIFPCPKCGNPAKQIQDTMTHLKGSQMGMLWFDIEGREYWTTDKTTNRHFFEGMINASRSLGIKFGVYSSASQWGEIFGLDYHGGSALQLWYAHYDKSPSFSDFVSFGGWAKPSIKQYNGDISSCGCGIDQNFY